MTDEPRPQNHPSAGHCDRCPFTRECGSRNHPLVRRQIFTRREYHRDKRVYNETSQNNPSHITTVTIGLQLWVTLLLPWIPVMPGKAKNSLKTPLTISKPKKSPSAHHVEPVGGQEETPKSTRLAYKIAGELRRSGVHATLIEVPKLTIHPCEGNVSDSGGNNCGLKKAILKDKNKNPSGQHRCWASLNNADDELLENHKGNLYIGLRCVLRLGKVGRTEFILPKTDRTPHLD